jgi:PAS domain-containing protein
MGIMDRQTAILFFDIAATFDQMTGHETQIHQVTSFASALLEASPDGVFVIDRNYRIINSTAVSTLKREDLDDDFQCRSWYRNGGAAPHIRTLLLDQDRWQRRGALSFDGLYGIIRKYDGTWK